MAISTPQYLKSMYSAARAMGDRAVSSDATMVIRGYEHLSVLIKQFPWPIATPMGEIEIALPMGAVMYQPQQIKIQHQGPITLYETKEGHVQAAIDDLVANQSARFDARVFEGDPNRYTRMLDIYDAFFQLDNPDRDMENRSQAMTLSGTMFFHYFGDSTPGNE